MLQNVFNLRAVFALMLSATCLLTTTGRLAQAQNQTPAQTAPPPISAHKITKIASEGVFTDKAKIAHAWQINGAHTLIWDNAPYIPVGGTFTPRSFISTSEADWQADVRTLDTLNSNGLHDIILWPSQPLASVPVPAVQRLLDYLDAKGFHYGVSFGSGMTQPLTGYVVKPSVYRTDARPRLSGEALLTTEWITPETDRGVIVMYDGANDSAIFRAPIEVPVRDGVLSIPIEAPPTIAHPYVMLLPHKTLLGQESGRMPDVWAAFDTYRDRMLAFQSQIKWGPGLRFFLDPLSRHMGLTGEAQFLVPDSPAFRLQWESYLHRRYANPEEARGKWALADRFQSFTDLSRLIPLWSYSGCPYFYDPQTKRFHRMLEGTHSAANSQWWNDFQVCRDTSLNSYMNTLADVLKKNVANVPIVYTWNPAGSFFVNNTRNGGFDGLAMPASVGESSRVARAFGPAYSQAEQSTHATWFVSTEIAASTPAPASQVNTVALTTPQIAPASPTYANRLALLRDFEDMRHIGVKGFFIRSLQSATASPESGSANVDWLANPESLSWLSEYATSLHRDGSAANFRPRVLFYPYTASGPAHTGLIPGTNSVYWLPGAFPGDSQETQPTAIDLWPAYSGYNIQRGDGEPLSTVMVSLTGQRKTHFPVTNPALVHAYTPEGAPVPVKLITKNTVEITLDTTPTILQFGTNLPPVPQEAAEDTLLQLATLYEIAKLQKVFGADNSRLALDQSKDYYAKKNYYQAYSLARSQLEILTGDTQPYIWIEGEQDLVNLFNEKAGHPETSQGAYRRLSTPNPPLPGLPYKAYYKFPAVREGTYQIWLAGTLPGPNTSPIKWQMNNDADKDIAEARPHGPTYLNDRFGWVLLGSAKLIRGENTLSIEATDPAAASREYTFAIDAIVITDKPFTPNTTIRPLPVDPVMIREFRKEKKNSKDKSLDFP